MGEAAVVAAVAAVAAGEPGVGAAPALLLVVSPVVDASAVWIQLRAGMMRASSRMKRSQSKRVEAIELTLRRRWSLIVAKSVKAFFCAACASSAVAFASAEAASLVFEVTWLDTRT